MRGSCPESELISTLATAKVDSKVSRKSLDAIREDAGRGEASNPLCSSTMSDGLDGVTSVIDAGSLHHFIRRSQRIVAWLWSSSSVGLEMAIPSPWVKQFISDSLFNQNNKSRQSNINDDGFHQRSLRASIRGRRLSVHIFRRLSSAYVEARARRPQRRCALLCVRV